MISQSIPTRFQHWVASIRNAGVAPVVKVAIDRNEWYQKITFPLPNPNNPVKLLKFFLIILYFQVSKRLDTFLDRTLPLISSYESRTTRITLRNSGLVSNAIWMYHGITARRSMLSWFALSFPTTKWKDEVRSKWNRVNQVNSAGTQNGDLAKSMLHCKL